MNLRCSQLPQAFLCPASVREQVGLPEKKNDDANEGTMLHGSCAGEEHELTPDQKRTVDWALTLRDRLVTQTFNEGFEVAKEIELSSPFENGNLTGHADFVAYSENTALIVDYKFGRIEVESAELNHQLRGYAVLVARHFRVESVVVAVIQPRVESAKQVTMCRYSHEDILQAIDEIDTLFVEVSHPNAPHAPSEDACRYCRAKENFTCPALKSELVQSEQKLLATPTVELATNDELEKWMDKLPLLEKALKAIKEEFRSRVESHPELFPKWGFKDGRKTREITNPQEAFNRLGMLTPEEFISTCKVSVPQIEELVIAKVGIKKKEGKEFLKSLLGDCLEESQSKASLERKS